MPRVVVDIFLVALVIISEFKALNSHQVTGWILDLVNMRELLHNSFPLFEHPNGKVLKLLAQ